MVMSITHSIISDNMANEGGGVYNAVSLVMTDSTLSGNTAAIRGGGMHNLGDATIGRSTFNANTSPSGEGGGYLYQRWRDHDQHHNCQ